MRGTFALVVAAGIAAAVGFSVLRGRSETSAAPPAPERAQTASDPGERPPQAPEQVSNARPPVTVSEAPRTDAAEEARAFLGADATVLAAPESRRRALELVDLLLARAESAPSREGISLRTVARNLVAAVYDRDESSKAERDAAFQRSRELFEILVRGNGAPPELVLRHKVEAGENVWALARGPWKTAGATVAPGFVLWVNGVSDARRVRVGQTLKVPLQPLRVLVRKSSFELTVLLGGAPVDRFTVAVGADAKTPVGTFRAGDCLKNPDWYIDGKRIPYGSPGHIIGTRWIALTGAPEAEGIGIHGTDDETSIGKPVSLGCVRMRNADVERIFDWVAPGTVIEIRD